MDLDERIWRGYPHSPLWEQLSWRIAGAHSVDILAAFVQLSGLAVIEAQLFEALRAGAQVRILVSDYLYISAPKALRTLLGWSDLAAEEFDDDRLHVRLIETARLPTAPDSFHPKAWRIVEGSRDFISVGSSNLSRAALVSGVEWNLLSTSTGSEPSHRQFSAEFRALWQVASPLTPELVESYAESAAQYRQEHFLPEADDVQEIPEPRPWQIEALASLARVREAGHSRALVAVATGMGKTWLAAFDACQFGETEAELPTASDPLESADAIVTRVQVTNETTLGAAKRLVGAGLRPLALNFANGFEIGGGFLRGATAQEEALCRSSALYATLLDDPMYAFHREGRHLEASSWSIAVTSGGCIGNGSRISFDAIMSYMT